MFDVAIFIQKIFRLKDVEMRRGNLEERLDYADDSFDSIVCVEGLEHAENPQNAIREFARLLRKGGHLIVSVPNILNVEERMKWLLHGYTSHFKPLSAEHLAKARVNFGDRLEITLHINPIGYSEFATRWRSTGSNRSNFIATNRSPGHGSTGPSLR